MKLRIDSKHRYYLGSRRVPGFTEVCTAMGVIKPSPYYTEQGREEGKRLHEWLLFLVQNKTPTTSPHPSIAARVEAIKKFIRDTGFRLSGGESPLYDPVTDTCCTPDIFGHIGPWSWVIDAKRGAMMEHHAIQTAAQKMALAPIGFHAQKRGCLYLFPTGNYRLHEHTGRRDEAVWKRTAFEYHESKKLVSRSI